MVRKAHLPAFPRIRADGAEGEGKAVARARGRGSDNFVGFYLQAGKLRAAVGLNRGGDPEKDKDGELAKAGRLIAKGARPSPTWLADEKASLESR